MANARRINLAIQYDGTDISSSVASFLESCTISDVMGGSADSVDITLQDKNKLWQGDWLPDRGALLTIALTYPPHRRLRNAFRRSLHISSPYPPHRRLRNVCSQTYRYAGPYPPHRRLRKHHQSRQTALLPYPPHRRLRKGAPCQPLEQCPLSAA